MGNEASNSVDIPSEATFSTFLEEVASEIDYQYATTPSVPDFVKQISSIKNLYTLQNRIGAGASASVFVAQSNETSRKYALKRLQKSDTINFSSFMREITVLQHLQHPNIINFNGAYNTDEHYYISTEYCCGGTLLERIMKLKRFSEKDCAQFMQKVLQGIHHMHTNNIVHRDIKLSNIVFDSVDIQNSKLKIIDFGESELITNMDETDLNCVGSLHFLPPETTRKRRKRELFAGDMWAIGVLTFTLINGVFPYRSKAKDITSLLRSMNNPLKWNISISDSCKDFVQSLLHKNCANRLSAKQALVHPWIVSKASDADLGDAYFQRLQCLQYQNKLQEIMVNAVLGSMHEADKKCVMLHDSYEDDTQLINQILSGTTPTGMMSRKTYSFCTPIHDLDKAIEDMDVDAILDGIHNDIDDVLDDLHEEKTTKAEAVTPTTPPHMDDTISVERFVDILQSSHKTYDIDQIVSDITDDGIEAITYRRISAYHRSVDPVDLSEIN